MTDSKIDLYFWRQIGLRRFFVVPMLALIALSTLESFTSSVLVFLIALVTLAVWFGALVKMCAVCLFRRRWRLALCYGLITASCVSAPFGLSRFGDFIHFAILYPEYRVQIETAPAMEHSFAWGVRGGSAASPATTRTLIYQPQEKTEDPLCYMTRLGGRFYVRNCSDY